MKNAGQNFYARAGLAGLAFVPWLVLLCAQVTNFDAMWLTTCAGRVLEGQRLSESCYDPNPPLSILIYLIPALLGKFAGLSKTVALPLYDMALLALSALAVNAILKTYSLTERQRHALLFAYLIGNTLFTGQWFGERDQFVLIGLFPLALLQADLTRGYDLPERIKWPVLILGGVAVLIKPYYGLIPLALLAYRAVTQKRLTVFGDIDCAVLAAVTAAYAALVYFMFGDYVTLVIPDALRLYALPPFHGHSVWKPALIVGALVALAMTGVWSDMKDRAGKLSLFLLAMAFLCLLPYIAQNKGFVYHFIPAMVFLLCGLALPLMGRLRDRTGLKLCLAITAAGYLNLLTGLALPHHAALKDYVITQEAGAGGPGCTFFLFDDIDKVQEVANYTRCGLASRFAYLWFLQPLLIEKYNAGHNLPHTLSGAQADAYLRKYAGMVTADFRRYKPGTVILAQLALTPDGPFDFPAFFTAMDPDFAAEWKNYEFVRQDVTPRPGPVHDRITFLIYRRKIMLF